MSDGYSAANAGFAGLKAYDAINNLSSMVMPDANGNYGNIASASVGIGFEYSKSKENAESSIPVVTGIRGGNSVSIEAKSGDINSHGAQIVAGYDENGLLSGGAGDINLKAGNDINLESAQATNSSSSSSKSAGASVGYSVGVGLGGAAGGWTGSANGSSGKSNSNGTTQVNTHVTGTGNINIESGRDTNLKGAVVEGETITANVGRDLNIISVPDTGESSNSSTSFGISGSLTGGVPKVTGVSPGYGTGSGETNWIGEQSGLVSKGEMDVRVEGNTHLGAGKIVSESGDLKLDTGTLTHEDFSGSKKYEGFDIQANIDLTPKDADGNKQQQPDQTSQPKTTAEGTYQLDDTRQEVRATVGPGEIIIRDKDKQAELEASGQTEDVAALNRDPDKAYEITKDKHVEIEYYLSETSLNAVASSIGKAMEPGSFVDRYLLGKNLTPEERSNIREGLDAINNGGSFGGCGGQRQGFNRYNPLGWIVASAYAYDLSCTIIKADGTRIKLGVQTYENCKDSIQAYLNSLPYDERITLIRSVGAASGSGLIAANFEDMTLAGWFLDAVYKLDQSSSGPNTQVYLQAKSEAQQMVINLGPTLYQIWHDPSLNTEQKFAEMAANGIDVGQLMASAMLGVAVGGLKLPTRIDQKAATHILDGRVQLRVDTVVGQGAQASPNSHQLGVIRKSSIPYPILLLIRTRNGLARTRVDMLRQPGLEMV